jgi:hypothetical protein
VTLFTNPDLVPRSRMVHLSSVETGSGANTNFYPMVHGDLHKGIKRRSVALTTNFDLPPSSIMVQLDIYSPTVTRPALEPTQLLVH